MIQKTKKIVIDTDACIGCGTCPLMCPKYFKLDSTTYKAKVKKQPDTITQEIKDTIDSCPVSAIRLQ